MWGKVSCLRKQHGGGDWASNTLTTACAPTNWTRKKLKMYYINNGTQYTHMYTSSQSNYPLILEHTPLTQCWK